LARRPAVSGRLGAGDDGSGGRRLADGATTWPAPTSTSTAVPTSP